MSEQRRANVRLTVYVSEVRPHCVVFEKSPVTHRLKQPSLCYCTLFSITLTVFTLEISSDIMLCVCVTHFAKGRKKVCRQNDTHSVIGAGGSVPVKTKTCLQVWSMYVLEFCP